MKMFKNFYADAYFKDITEVSSQFLKEHGIEAMILDVDNTLVGHDVPIPEARILSHLRSLENDGIRLCIVSNNTMERVAAFAEKIDIKYFVADAFKPSKKGYDGACETLSLSCEKIAAIGDQVFTDVWGAKRAGCFAILTKPLYKGGETFFIAIKRILEKPFIINRF